MKDKLVQIPLVFIGGVVGVLCRHLLSHLLDGGVFGILLVNVIATFLAGVVSVVITSERIQATLMTGFLGGFSTLAAVEILALQDGPLFLIYLPLTIAAGLVTCWLGTKLGRTITGASKEVK